MSRTRLRPVRWNSAFNLLSLLSVAGLGTHFACSNAIEDDDGTVTSAAVTNGTGNAPVCEGGVRDGFCNALGGDPESCLCLDCSQTAYCKSLCVNDGQCNQNAGEDCTCIDCVGQTVGDDTCQGLSGDQGPGPGPTAASTASSGSGASTAATTAATTAASTAAATSSAASGTGGAGG